MNAFNNETLPSTPHRSTTPFPARKDAIVLGSSYEVTQTSKKTDTRSTDGGSGRLARLLEAALVHSGSRASMRVPSVAGGFVTEFGENLDVEGLEKAWVDEQRRKDMEERWRRRHVSALDLHLD